jgi:tryptophanase
MEKVEINKEKNEVVIRFNQKFYTQPHIDQAIEDFKEVCDARKEGNDLILKPKQKEDLDRLGYEFYNYVLGLMKNT